MLALAALMLATASPTPSPALTSAAPWWEKFTFTMTKDGTQQACQYQSSLPIAGGDGCGNDDSSDQPSTMHRASNASGGSYTKITIERRFTPATQPEAVRLEAGDTLLGEQVMALAIDSGGSVQKCEIVGTKGDMKPPYGCEEARTERFEASAGRALEQVRHGFMTVLVYGHEEYPV